MRPGFSLAAICFASAPIKVNEEKRHPGFGRLGGRFLSRLPGVPMLSDAHILVVDDQPDELKLLLEALRATGCRVSVAFDGVQACQRAQALLPDLILMDLRMPRMDGFAAARLLDADPATRGIPILFLTATGDLDARLEGFAAGARDFILKPYEPAEIVARIRVHLKQAAPREPAPPFAGGDPPEPGHARDDLFVRAAVDYLAKHLRDTPPLKQLAASIGTNDKRLSRAFQNRLGQTVFEYLREQRLRFACKLLDETPLNVTAIAGEVGFSSSANFATAFRERFGVTPTEWRNADRTGQAP